MALCAASLLMSATAARADSSFVLIETGTLDPITGNFPAPQLVSIPQFDPMKGELKFVVIRITANFDALIEAENLGGSGAIITTMATQTINVTPPTFVAPLPISETENIPVQSNPVGPFDGTIDFMGPSSTSFTYTPLNPRAILLANIMRDPMDVGFMDFIGGGSYDFVFDGFGDFTVSSNSGAVVAKANLTLDASIKVEYHYVPEPTSLALLAPALLFIRRRRRR